MRFSRPSTGTILGAIALFVALGGTAFAAGATVVNIADPTTPASIAHVNSSGQLQTSGSTSVTNTVSTEPAPPSAYLHGAQTSVGSGSGCVVLATPPPGKAMIIRDVKVDIFANPSPGPDEGVAVYVGTTCTISDAVADMSEPTIGETTLPFDPGLGVPANSSLFVHVDGSLQADTFADGYSVPSSQVPAVQAIPTRTKAKLLGLP